MYKKYDNDNAHIFKLVKYVLLSTCPDIVKKSVDSLY